MRRIEKKLLAFIIMGISPKRLALCIALGIALGLIPALGTTTLLCTLAAFLFRLNLAAIQIANFAVYPLQITLLLPYMQAGAWLFGGRRIHLSLEQIQGMLDSSLWGTVAELGIATMQAVAVWILTAPLVAGAVFLVLTPVLRKMEIERKIPAV
ncbi:MAG: DUF2062 domain-containing protein [Acidobacteria bacterium]|nr:DUF2062 domain-containing protein [Acidobacteriota bacterium]